jgi:hypothetical protein
MLLTIFLLLGCIAFALVILSFVPKTVGLTLAIFCLVAWQAGSLWGTDIGLVVAAITAALALAAAMQWGTDGATSENAPAGVGRRGNVFVWALACFALMVAMPLLARLTSPLWLERSAVTVDADFPSPCTWECFSDPAAPKTDALRRECREKCEARAAR